jgi:hypothetical protein
LPSFRPIAVQASGSFLPPTTMGSLLELMCSPTVKSGGWQAGSRLNGCHCRGSDLPLQAPIKRRWLSKTAGYHSGAALARQLCIWWGTPALSKRWSSPGILTSQLPRFRPDAGLASGSFSTSETMQMVCESMCSRMAKSSG